MASVRTSPDLNLCAVTGGGFCRLAWTLLFQGGMHAETAVRGDSVSRRGVRTGLQGNLLGDATSAGLMFGRLQHQPRGCVRLDLHRERLRRGGDIRGRLQRDTRHLFWKPSHVRLKDLRAVCLQRRHSQRHHDGRHRDFGRKEHGRLRAHDCGALKRQRVGQLHLHIERHPHQEVAAPPIEAPRRLPATPSVCCAEKSPIWGSFSLCVVRRFVYCTEVQLCSGVQP